MKITVSTLEYLKNLFFKLRCSTAKPVVVYQMGKVASSSIHLSLKATTDLNVFHLHRLNPENIELVRKERLRRGSLLKNEDRALYLYENLMKNPPNGSVKIISLVREPIGRNISAYFQNLQSFEGVQDAHNSIEVEPLIEHFIERYSHDVPLLWFDEEMRATTGIDVYEYTFPRDQGYQVIAEGPYQVIIMRHDLDDRLKEKYIAEFLELESFNLSRANEASSKEYADAYKRFVSSIKLPSGYVERMLSSKYARHFYSQEERRAFSERWTEPKKH